MALRDIKFDSSKTNFAPAKRADLKTVKLQYESIQNVELIDQVFSKIPLMFQILNNERQIIYINELLRKELEQKGIDVFLGYRPGELLQCTNAFENEGGCGTSNRCQFCGIIRCIIQAKKTERLNTDEAIFESDINGNTEITAFKISAKPFHWNNEVYTIVTFENINDKKRKEQLERTFFHDLMNKVSSISGISELLLMDETTQDNEFIQMIKRSIYDLADEVRFQRNIVSAEKDELSITNSTIPVNQLLKDLKEDFIHFESISKKTIVLLPIEEELTFQSDIVLVKRILTNLIKNSLEAIKSNEEINVGVIVVDKFIQFWVQNQLVLPPEIKDKIFKRTFSTKGEGRGIGTYSVKLFTEKYLNGKAYFTSDKENGTIFFVEFPLTINDK